MTADLALARRLRAQLPPARGWHELTMDELAHAAGVSRMTLHRRGLGRAELLDALRQLMREDFQRETFEALVADGPANERLRLALEGLARATEDNLAVLAALEDEPRDAIFHEAGDETLTCSEFTQPIERLLRDGALDGTIEVDDPVESATLLFNVVGWTYRHLRLGHRWNAERATRAIADLAVRGVARASAPPPRSARPRAT